MAKKPTIKKAIKIKFYDEIVKDNLVIYKEFEDILMKRDLAYQEEVSRIERNKVNLPFIDNNNIDMQYRNSWLRVNIMEKKLEIKKVLSGGIMYLIIQPLICDNYKIIGLFDNQRYFKGLLTEPMFGYHYLSDKYLCTGDIKLKSKYDSFCELENICLEIFDSLSVVNLNSLGYKMFDPVFRKQPLNAFLEYTMEHGLSILEISEMERLGIIKPFFDKIKEHREVKTSSDTEFLIDIDGNLITVEGDAFCN